MCHMTSQEAHNGKGLQDNYSFSGMLVDNRVTPSQSKKSENVYHKKHLAVHTPSQTKTELGLETIAPY